MAKKDVWEVHYRNVYGDGEKMTVSVPHGTPSFKIIGIARKQSPMWWKYLSYKKISGGTKKPVKKPRGKQ